MVRNRQGDRPGRFCYFVPILYLFTYNSSSDERQFRVLPLPHRCELVVQPYAEGQSSVISESSYSCGPRSRLRTNRAVSRMLVSKATTPIRILFKDQ